MFLRFPSFDQQRTQFREAYDDFTLIRPSGMRFRILRWSSFKRHLHKQMPFEARGPNVCPQGLNDMFSTSSLTN